MSGGPATTVLRFLRRLTDRDTGRASDAQLLARFALDRDEAAFAALVAQHGPMVLGVCLRVLGDAHAADDAFQATFLVLVRKAGTIAQPERLGSWLYGVAHRIAVKARAASARRQARMCELTDLPAPSCDELLWHDLRPVLDEEINRLPDRFREPFVLCCVEGKTNAEAALRIGCPTGTVLSRLSRARERLRTRLVRRGVTLSAAAVAALGAERALSAAVSTTLLETTVRTARLFATPATAGLVSNHVVTLTEGVLRAMFFTKVKIALAVLLVLGAAAGAGITGYGQPAARPQERAPEAPPEAALKPDDPHAAVESAVRLKVLLKERFDAANGEWNARWQEFTAGRNRDSLEVYFGCSQRLLVAAREMSENKAARIDAWHDHVMRMKQIEEICKAQYDAGRLSIGDYKQSQFYRLDAQIGLQRAKDDPAP